MPVSGEEFWRNVTRNENQYSAKEWAWITAHMPRKIWGIRVAYVANERYDTGHGRWYRAVAWWFGPRGKWLP